MKINYKNINQTFTNNIERYIEIKSKIIDPAYIVEAYSSVPIYLENLLKNNNSKYHNLLKKIKLSILVADKFFSEESVIGKNIVNSPLFDGYFKIRTKEFNYFLAIYDKKVLFYNFSNNDRKLENFCKRRFLF